MHYDRILYGLLAGLALFFICYPFAFRKKPAAKKALIGALFAYSGAVTFLTMLYAPPWNWNISSDSTWWAISKINFDPITYSMEIFKNCERTGEFKSFYVLIGGNLAMLMPLGILVPLINKRFRFVGITLLAMAVSASIEGFQLLSNILLGYPYRTVEIDDFILNVVGCIAAYIIFAAVRCIVRKFRKFCKFRKR